MGGLVPKDVGLEGKVIRYSNTKCYKTKYLKTKMLNFCDPLDLIFLIKESIFEHFLMFKIKF
jgi:hypothetical protein